jgi:signal transduction histidine kinase
MRHSVRSRTTLTAVGVMALAAVIAAIAVLVLLNRSLMRGVENRAVLRLQDVSALVQRGDVPPTLAGSDEDGTLAQVVIGGQVRSESPVLEGHQPLARFVPPGVTVSVRTVRFPNQPGGTRYRVAARRLSAGGEGAVVYAAASLEPVTDSLHAVEALVALTVPSLVLLVGLLTWWLVGRTLEPVEAIRRQVSDISASALERRVSEPTTRDEIQRLAVTMNEMLDRLHSAATRQKEFVSDAAHELRGPLAAMKVELETATAHPATIDLPVVLDRLRSSSRRMERLVEDLLVLASTEEQGTSRRAELDLDELVLRHLEPLRLRHHPALDTGGLGGARIWGDPDQLERVVANLLDNAERHAASSIAVELRTVDGAAELVVADDGPGIPEAERKRVFDRFTRVDIARDRRRGGAGLGLAIVRRIVEHHGGSIEVADSPAGTRMVVRLPVDPGSPP